MDICTNAYSLVYYTERKRGKAEKRKKKRIECHVTTMTNTHVSVVVMGHMPTASYILFIRVRTYESVGLFFVLTYET